MFSSIVRHVSTVAQNGQTKHWLQRGPFHDAWKGGQRQTCRINVCSALIQSCVLMAGEREQIEREPVSVVSTELSESWPEIKHRVTRTSCPDCLGEVWREQTKMTKATSWNPLLSWVKVDFSGFAGITIQHYITKVESFSNNSMQNFNTLHLNPWIKAYFHPSCPAKPFLTIWSTDQSNAPLPHSHLQIYTWAHTDAGTAKPEGYLPPFSKPLNAADMSESVHWRKGDKIKTHQA